MKTIFGQKSSLATSKSMERYMALAFFPAKGFLGSGATFAADFNLLVQLAMGAALVVGVFLARHKRFAAHGLCQTTVLLLNLVMIITVMLPSFHQQVRPPLRRVLHRLYYALPTIHAILGMAAEFVGIYIVLVAKTNVLPTALRFTNWKRWMRMEFALWSVVLLIGVATYYRWYIAPFQ